MAAFPLSSVTEDVSSSKGASHGRSMFPSGAADAQYSNLYRSLDYPADSSARRTLSAGGGGAQLGRGRGGSGWLPSWLRPSFGAAESRDIESSGREASLRDARADDIDDEEEEELFCGCFEPLSPSERILGWLTCFLGNLVLSAVSLGSFNDMLLGRNNKFAVTYSVANCVGLAGTAFLVGPAQQVRNMVDSSRLLTSCAFLCSLFLTLFFSVYVKVGVLIVFCVAVQWLAYIWYSISYIPFARRGTLWLLSRLARFH